MKTLKRAMELIAGASIAFAIAGTGVIKGGIFICLALVIYLPVAAQFDGDRDEN